MLAKALFTRELFRRRPQCRKLSPARHAWSCVALGVALVWADAPLLHATSKNAAFAPTPSGDETYGESFTIISELDDHTFLLFQFLFTNAGVGDRKAACRLMYRPVSKALAQFGRQFEADEWHYVAAENRLQVGECSLSGTTEESRFAIRLDGVDATLRMKAPAVSVEPTPTIRGEWGYYAQDVLTPWARVQVTIREGQQAPITREGWGYFDHTRSEALLPKVASNWVRFRGFYEGVPLVLQVRFAPNGELGDAWLWRKGDAKATRIIAAKRLEQGETPRWELKTETHSLRIEADLLLYVYEPTKSYGLLGKLARPFVGNPKTSTYRGTMRSASLGSVRGTIEWSQIEH